MITKVQCQFYYGKAIVEILPRFAYWKFVGSNFIAKHLLIGWLFWKVDIYREMPKPW